MPASAIVCLTKGYADPSGYDALIERNRSIYQVINRHRVRQYPLIIWHEGNISAGDQSHILKEERNAEVRFVDISPMFQLPQGLKKTDLVEGWRVGYRLMCRFYYWYIWQLTTAFDYVMRLDEDCTLHSAAFDPIESLSRAGGDFAAAVFVREMHELTNRTLAPFAERFTSVLRLKVARSTLYNHAFPYTNLFVTRTAFWRQAHVQQFLYAVAREPGSLRFRWGDLPVLGVALNMFGRRGKVYRIPEIGYTHGSHHWTMKPAR